MVKIAIAGGTGALGRTIQDVLAESLQHEAVVLCRTRSGSLTANDQLVEVDYNDIPSLQSILETHNIQVVIATFHMSMGALTSQLNLIEAANRSKCTVRFIPTSFAIPYPEEATSELKLLKLYFDAIELLKTTGLEWTVFHNGIFLDYFAMPHIRTHLSPNVIAIDVADRIAAIPGTGDVPVTFTYTYDVAKFVIAALDLPVWSRETRVVGDVLTWNQFVDLAEEIIGMPFTRTYDSIKKLKAFEVTELSGHIPLYGAFPKKTLQWFLSLFELWTTDETSHIAYNGSLNEAYPEVEMLKAKDMLERYWI